MSYVVMIIVLLVIAAAMVAALVYATKAASDITKIDIPGRTWNQNSHLRDAHTMMTWVAIGGWIIVFLLLVAIIAYFVAHGVSSTDKKGGGHRLSPILTIVLLILSAVALAIGILAVLAAENMKQAQGNSNAPVSPSNPVYKKAYNETIIAASLGIGVIGLLVLMWVIILTTRHAAKNAQLKTAEASKEKLVAEEREHKKLEETLTTEKATAR